MRSWQAIGAAGLILAGCRPGASGAACQGWVMFEAPQALSLADTPVQARVGGGGAQRRLSA